MSIVKAHPNEVIPGWILLVLEGNNTTGVVDSTGLDSSGQGTEVWYLGANYVPAGTNPSDTLVFNQYSQDASTLPAALKKLATPITVYKHVVTKV